MIQRLVFVVVIVSQFVLKMQLYIINYPYMIFLKLILLTQLNGMILFNFHVNVEA